MPTYLEVNIHGARPFVHRSGSLVWLTVPAGAEKATVFLADPDVAEQIGLDLVRHAAVAKRVRDAEVEVAAPVEEPVAASGRDHFGHPE